MWHTFLLVQQTLSVTVTTEANLHIGTDICGWWNEYGLNLINW